MQGLFVTFEGIEGSGKSTQISHLRGWLCSRGHDVVMTREPGGTAIGEKIRELLLSGNKCDIFSSRAELLLFEAIRAQHMEELILPAIENKKVVLCDRFFDSTIVYQGIARKIDKNVVDELNTFASFEKKPDITVIIDIDVSESMRRMSSSHKLMDRIEQEGRDFFEKIKNGYLDLARSDDRFFVVDGMDAVDIVQKKIRDEFSRRFVDFR